MTPMLQTSTALPYGFCANTSGAVGNIATSQFYFTLVCVFQEDYIKKATLTDITRSSARSGHDTGILHFGQTEITDHYFAVFIRTVIQQILRLYERKSQFKK